MRDSSYHNRYLVYPTITAMFEHKGKNHARPFALEKESPMNSSSNLSADECFYVDRNRYFRHLLLHGSLIKDLKNVYIFYI